MCKGCWMPEVYAENLIKDACAEDELPMLTLSKAVAELQKYSLASGKKQFSVFRKALIDAPENDTILVPASKTSTESILIDII